MAYGRAFPGADLAGGRREFPPSGQVSRPTASGPGIRGGVPSVRSSVPGVRGRAPRARGRGLGIRGEAPVNG